MPLAAENAGERSSCLAFVRGPDPWVAPLAPPESLVKARMPGMQQSRRGGKSSHKSISLVCTSEGQRRLMTKGIKMGSWVAVSSVPQEISRKHRRSRRETAAVEAEAVRYRVPIKQEIDENDTGHYEGRIIDKRIGGQDHQWGSATFSQCCPFCIALEDRESFIELKDVLKVDIDGNIIGKEKQKRLIDAFIEDCKAMCLSARMLCCASRGYMAPINAGRSSTKETRRGTPSRRRAKLQPESMQPNKVGCRSAAISHTDLLQEAAKLQGPPAVVNQADSSLFRSLPRFQLQQRAAAIS